MKVFNEDALFAAHESFKLADFSDALMYYKQGLDDDPGNPSILINIGFVYYFMYDFKQARDYFIQALHVNEENQIAWFGLFIAAKRLGDKSLVQTALLRVHQINDLPFDLLISNIETFYEN